MLACLMKEIELVEELAMLGGSGAGEGDDEMGMARYHDLWA